jgi:hypothetical protein
LPAHVGAPTVIFVYNAERMHASDLKIVLYLIRKVYEAQKAFNKKNLELNTGHHLRVCRRLVVIDVSM